MRIIAGKLKGRKIIAPKNLPVRPTTDMAKEGLFNILSHRIHFPSTKLLDLYSGIGSISLEFFSRGGKGITSVDGNYGCIKFLQSKSDEFEADITCLKSDVFLFLANHKNSYDLIFADPPYIYTKEEFQQLVELIFSNQLLEEDGLFILEHPKHTDLSDLDKFSESRKYGNSVFSFFTN